MCDDFWALKEIGDFIYLLNCYAPDEKDVLQRRFKKSKDAMDMLYDILEKLDELGFNEAIRFGQDHRYIGKVSNNKHLTLIEIRVKKTFWRVLTFVDYEKGALVMIDAFENHKSKTMDQFVNDNVGRIRIAKELLEEGGQHGTEG